MRTSTMILAAAGSAAAFNAGPSMPIRRIGRVAPSMSLRPGVETSNPRLLDDAEGRGAMVQPKGVAVGILGSAALAVSLALSPVTVGAETFSPEAILVAEAVDLPAGWESALSEDGKEFFYNSKTGQSQWESPAVEKKKEGKKAKNRRSGGSSNNLNEIVSFEPPTVPVDRITVKNKVTLDGQCGESDFRSNSIECGEPALNPVEDALSKGVGTIGTLLNEDNIKALKEKSNQADNRARMLQEAEMKALAKTDIFKKLDSQTKDPVRAAERKKKVDAITDANDLGSRQAPWSAPEDPAETGKLPVLKLPELKMPEFKLPF